MHVTQKYTCNSSVLWAKGEITHFNPQTCIYRITTNIPVIELHVVPWILVLQIDPLCWRPGALVEITDLKAGVFAGG